MRGIHRWPVNSLHKGQWLGALTFSLICARINVCVNNGEAGHLRRHCAHYDVTVMVKKSTGDRQIPLTMDRWWQILSFATFFVVSTNKPLNKLPTCRRPETSMCACDVTVMTYVNFNNIYMYNTLSQQHANPSLYFELPRFVLNIIFYTTYRSTPIYFLFQNGWYSFAWNATNNVHYTIFQ